MGGPLQRDLVAGSVAGFVAGNIVGAAAQASGAMAVFGGVGSPAGFAIYVLIAVALGGGFGALFRYQHSYAATISSGILYGLLWWIAWPLTFLRLVQGHAPTWSLGEATSAYPSLISYLLYGAILGLSFYVAVTVYLGGKPEPGPRVIEARAPAKRVVILGGGFAGVSAAERLEKLFPDGGVDVTLVSHSNYLLFTPMLSEVASSGLEAQHISPPLRAVLRRTRVRHADTEAIDVTEQLVQIRAIPGAAREALPYEHLILALGAVPFYYGIPGMGQHAFTLKTLEDAIRLRNHVISMLERADTETDPIERRRELTFVVVGGGFAGTEMIAELFDLVYSTLRYYPNIPDRELRFVLVHGGDHLLPEISTRLGDYALQKLRRRGIEFVLNMHVVGAIGEAAVLEDGREIPTRTLVWTAGNQPNPLLKTLSCERNRAGAVIADSTLLAKGFTNVWAVGDCAQVPDLSNDRKPCPPTAQHALRQGKVVADNVAASLLGKPIKHFNFRTIGLLVALGHRTAVADLRGLMFSGLFAWLMWRMIYWSKLPGLEKKVRVSLDWGIDLLFPRDIVLTAESASATPSGIVHVEPDAAKAPVAASAGAGAEHVG